MDSVGLGRHTANMQFPRLAPTCDLATRLTAICMARYLNADSVTPTALPVALPPNAFVVRLDDGSNRQPFRTPVIIDVRRHAAWRQFVTGSIRTTVSDAVTRPVQIRLLKRMFKFTACPPIDVIRNFN